MVPRDRSGPDQSGLDTWLTGVVAICAATLLFSGVLLIGIGAAAHATDPTNAPSNAADADSRPPASPSRDPNGEPTTEAPPTGADDDPTTTRQRQPSTTRPKPWDQTQTRTQRAPAPPPTPVAQGPDPGSSPQYALPVTVPTDDPDDPALNAADAQDDVGSLDHSSRQALGEQLFVAGLVGLLFSIGGLVTIAIRGQAW